MSLPYRWDPDRFFRMHLTYKACPEVGDLIPYEHAVYRVVRVRTTEPDAKGRTTHVRVVPVSYQPTGDPVADRNAERPFTGGPKTRWGVYPTEHYPICAACLEPMPCRHEVAAGIAKSAGEKFDRYTEAGVCPACREVVSQRQRSVTWEDNAVVPGGPPVTFHLRRKCRSYAVEYERRWHALDPGARRMLYTCGEHHVRNHGDGTYSCTNVECPGPTAWHRSWARCDCPEHQWTPHGCNPPSDARRV